MSLSQESKNYLISGMSSLFAGNELIAAIQNVAILSQDSTTRLQDCFGEPDIATNFQNCILGSYALSARDVEFVKEGFSLPVSALSSVLSNLVGGVQSPNSVAVMIGYPQDFNALLVKLDSDSGVSFTNYENLSFPSNNLVSLFNSMLMKLDSDSGVTDINYYSTLKLTSALNFSTKFNALLTKLDTDTGVAYTNYYSTLHI